MTMFQFQCKFRRLRRYLLAPGFFAVVAIIAVLAAAASADTIANPKENPFTEALDFKPKLYHGAVGWECGGVKMGVKTADAYKLYVTSAFLVHALTPTEWAVLMGKDDPKRAPQYIRMAEQCQGGPRT